jgi:hypothetical protein
MTHSITVGQLRLPRDLLQLSFSVTWQDQNVAKISLERSHLSCVSPFVMQPRKYFVTYHLYVTCVEVLSKN